MSRNFFKAVMVGAFVAFAGISILTINNIHREVTSTVLASNSSIPRAWSDFPATSDAVASLDVVTSDEVIIYTVKLQNTRDLTLYLTNFASYLDEAHGDRDGFLNLTADTAEASYDESDPSSWFALSLSAPKNGLTGFRLANNLALGPAGSDIDTLYLRFQVSPSLDQDVVSNKITALLDDANGYTSVATASTSVAVNIEEAPITVVAADTSSENPHALFDRLAAGTTSAATASSSSSLATSDASADSSSSSSNPATVAVSDDVDSAFARPLGVFAEQLDLKTVASVVTSAETVDDSFINTTNLILVGILGVFAIAFIGYIVVVKF